MADARGRVITTITTRHEYILNSPAPVGEIQKAISWARAEQPEDKRPYDDTVRVESRDDEVVVWWEETQDHDPSLFRVAGDGRVVTLRVSRISDLIDEVNRHYVISDDLAGVEICACRKWNKDLDTITFKQHVSHSVLNALTWEEKHGKQ